MKILIVTFEFDDEISGGIGTCLNGLYPYLKKLVEVYVARLYWNYSGNFFSCELYSPEGKKIISDSHYIDYINDFISFNEITHLHIHHASERMADVVDSVSNNKKINPVIVYSCHSIFKYEEKIRKIPQSWIKEERRIIEKCNVIHVLNNASLKWLKSAYFDAVKEKVIHVIPNGISQNSESLSAFSKTPTNKIVCASRWVPGKGIEHFIDAIPLVQQSMPGSEFVLIGRNVSAWGENVRPYIDYLDAKVSKLTSQNITVHNWMPKDVVYKIMVDAKACVIPSEIEYFPYSFMEPALFGVPIVCSRLEPIQEIAKENTHYLGFDPGNYQEMAARIIDSIKNSVGATNRANQAKVLMIKKFSWREISRSYLSLYQSI